MEQLDFIQGSDSGPSNTAEKAREKRAKTSLRLRYETEMAVLKRDLGSLEDIRIRLGLSRRKICQILMVDPSAWTRWTSGITEPPPHIYQALRWYTESRTHDVSKIDKIHGQMMSETLHLRELLRNLEQTHRRSRYWIMGLGIVAVLGVVFALLR